MRYRCLVLDHDDTVVRSTPTLNYPAFMRSLAVLRPGTEMSLEQFLMYNYQPGFHELCRDILGYDEAEMAVMHAEWLAASESCIPDAYAGFDRLLPRYRESGGLICVVTHSTADVVRRGYRALFGLEPDTVFGWEQPEERRKPYPWPLEEIMRIHGLSPEDMLMVDDLMPGCEMAHLCGVDFGYAGWSETVPALREIMCAAGEYSFGTVGELEELLLG